MEESGRPFVALHFRVDRFPSSKPKVKGKSWWIIPFSNENQSRSEKWIEAKLGEGPSPRGKGCTL